MARRKNIERLYRHVDHLDDVRGRKTFLLICIPYEDWEKRKDEFGTFSINHVCFVEKCTTEAIRWYGHFTDEDIKHVKAMKIGETWYADEHSLLVRVA